MDLTFYSNFKIIINFSASNSFRANKLNNFIILQLLQQATFEFVNALELWQFTISASGMPNT